MFHSFNILFYLFHHVFFTDKLPQTFYGMVFCGITKQFPISLQQLFFSSHKHRKTSKTRTDGHLAVSRLLDWQQ